MKEKLLIVAILSASFAAALDNKTESPANEIVTEPGAGSIEFEAIGRPNMLVIKGTGEGVTSSLTVVNSTISGEIKFNLESLKTGIEIRDQDMKEKYLQTKSYPVAKIVFDKFQMPAGWNIKSPKVVTSSFRGKLTLHGVEKEITGLFTISPDFSKTTAKFDVKLSDFKIQTPVYLGIKVADFVKVNVTINKIIVVK